MNRQLSKRQWNLVAIFFLAWFITAGWLLYGGDTSPSVRFAFGFCGSLGLLAESKGHRLRWIGIKFVRILTQYQPWVIGLGMIGLIAAFLTPSFNACNNNARASASLSALQKYGVALGGFSRDNGGRLPSRLGSAKMNIQLKFYIEATYNTPLTRIDPASQKPFVWRRSLGNLRLSDINRPEKLIIAYSPTYENTGDRRSVLFLDGHVKQLSLPDFWEAWRGQPELPTLPKRGKLGKQPIH